MNYGRPHVQDEAVRPRPRRKRHIYGFSDRSSPDSMPRRPQRMARGESFERNRVPSSRSERHAERRVSPGSALAQRLARNSRPGRRPRRSRRPTQSSYEDSSRARRSARIDSFYPADKSMRSFEAPGVKSYKELTGSSPPQTGLRSVKSVRTQSENGSDLATALIIIGAVATLFGLIYVMYLIYCEWCDLLDEAGKARQASPSFLPEQALSPRKETLVFHPARSEPSDSLESVRLTAPSIDLAIKVTTENELAPFAKRENPLPIDATLPVEPFESGPPQVKEDHEKEDAFASMPHHMP